MDTTSAQQTFSSLASAMDEIHNRNASTLSFEELYRNAYNLVLHKHGSLLYEGVQDRLAMHLRHSGGKLIVVAREESVANNVISTSSSNNGVYSSGGSYKLLAEMGNCWKEHRITRRPVYDL